MADPRVLIILVATGGADPTSASMARATREALGVDARVEVRETGHRPGDMDALAVERDVHPDAVVELSWADANAEEATLRVHVARSDRWIDRTIGFAISDAPPERGRTLGFAVASMMPEIGGASRSDVPPSPVVTPPAPPSAAQEVPRTVTPPPRIAADQPVVRGPSVGAAPPWRSTLAFDVGILGTLGVDGTATALGGGGGLRVLVAGPVSLRAGGEILGGAVDAAQGTLLDVITTAGVAVHPWLPTPRHPFGLSARVDYLLLYEALSHSSPGDPSPTTQYRWMSGVDVVLEGDWLFVRNIGVFAGIGAQDTFSPTYVDVQGARVATLPPVRGKASTGLRVQF
jgi:hypothetical protein